MAPSDVLTMVLLMHGGVHGLSLVPAPTLTPRSPARVVRHPRLPVWPAWQGLVLGITGQVPGLRGVTDFLEDKFGGRVCPMSLDASDCDPFILLVHHRHAFRPLDFLRPLFSAIIMPEGFPAHPHRSQVSMRGPAAARTGTRRSRSPTCLLRARPKRSALEERLERCCGEAQEKRPCRHRPCRREAPPREAPSDDQKRLGWCFGACLKPPTSPLATPSASAAPLACRHRGFETVTYVLPERAGLVHRDSIGTKMSYGDGAVQWMTAGRGTPHEETNPSLNPNPNFPPNPNPHPNPPHDP